MDKRLWVILVLAIVLLVLVYRKVSGYTSPSVSLSMMDLKEFSYLSSDQKDNYLSQLSMAAPLLSSNVSNMQMYQMTLNTVMTKAFVKTSTTTMMCSNVIVMGDCIVSSVCPPGLTMRTVGTNKYCVCPTGQVIMASSTRAPVCQPGPCPTTMKTMTEQATGQMMCVPTCPPTKPGYVVSGCPVTI